MTTTTIAIMMLAGLCFLAYEAYTATEINDLGMIVKKEKKV